MDPITSEEDVKYLIGKFYFQNNDYKKAIKIYKKGLVNNPHSMILLYETGLAYLKLKDHKIALKYWRKLFKIDPCSFLAVKIRQRLKKQKSKQ